MVWVKLDDQFSEHPKMHAAGPLGLAMQVAALCYSNRHLTDGFIPTNAAKKLIDLDDIKGVAWRGVVKRLVDAGAWREVEGGWQLHDYSEYQPTKAQVEAERAAAKERMQRVRANKRRTHAERSPEQTENFARSSGNVRQMFGDPVPVPDVPTERLRARTRDPTPKTTPPVFNGDAHEHRLRAEEAHPDIAEQHLADIRNRIRGSTDDTDD